MKRLLFLSLLFGVLISPVEAAIELTALPPTVRVRPQQEIQGAKTVELFAARNEVESFQVVITARQTNLQRIQVEMSPLVGPGKTKIPAADIKLFREIYIPIRYSAPRATQPPGLIPDALVPLKNPYTGEPIRDPRWDSKQVLGSRVGGGGFDLWRDHHQPIWVDIEFQNKANPGTYTGQFTVRARNGETAVIPVKVTVWDFELPAGPTHENHFGSFGRLGRYHQLKTDSEDFRRLEDRYFAMMAAHRLNPPLPRHLLPKIGPEGEAQFDSETDRRITDFVNRYHVTDIDIPRAPFSDVLGKNRAKAIRFYRSWYAYLEKKGWAKRSYLYMLDEPNTKEAYEKVRQLGALVREAEPQLRRLVVEQPYTQNRDWPDIENSIDIWCPLFGHIHEGSIQRVQAQGDEVWSYTALVQKAPSYHSGYEKVKNDDPPYWQMDFPVTSYRIAPWLNRRYGITGLLYWTTICWSAPERNPWHDPGFRLRYNGEGMLFYPGQDAGIEGPIASIRLKNLRDGMEDYEYFALLENLGGKEIVDKIVRSAVPTWGNWKQTPDTLLQLRKQLAKEILKRKGLGSGG
jgi:glycosyl hydrolase family 123